MKLIVVHNPSSGGSSSLHDIKQAFSEAGAQPIYLPITNVDKLPSMLDADTIAVAAGGDGTINSVAKHLLGTPATLGIIPVGTLNHFAKDLHVPLDIAGAVRVIMSAKTAEIDTGIVNDQIFINNSSIGWYPRSLLTREQLSGQIGKWPAAALGFFKAMSSPRRYHVELTIDGKQLAYRTPFVFVSNNPYTRAEPGVGTRDSLQSGRLAIYVVKAQNFLGILRMLIIGLFTKKQRTQDFSVHDAHECIINTKHHRTLHVARDGEVTDMPTPLHYESKPRSVRVLIP